MPPLPNYLYQYPQSKNFFFRIRIPSKVIEKVAQKPFTFIASLQSSNIEQSRWFAIFINSQLKKEWNSLVEINIKDYIAQVNARNERLATEGFSRLLKSSQNSSTNQEYEPKNWDFRAYLKERYSLYLAMAKDAIKTERQSYFDISKFDDVKESDSKRYEEYLKESIEAGNTASDLVK